MNTTRGEILVLVEKAKNGRSEELEDRLLELFEEHGTAPAVSKAIGITPATLYRWLDGPAKELGAVLQASGVVNRYETGEARRAKMR